MDSMELINIKQETKNTQNESNFMDSPFPKKEQSIISETDKLFAISPKMFISPSINTFIKESVKEETQFELQQKNISKTSLNDDIARLSDLSRSSSTIQSDLANYLDNTNEKTTSFANNTSPSNQHEKQIHQKNQLELTDLYKRQKEEYLANAKKYRKRVYKPDWDLQEKWPSIMKLRKRKQLNKLNRKLKGIDNDEFDNFDDEQLYEYLAEFYEFLYEDRFKEFSKQITEYYSENKKRKAQKDKNNEKGLFSCCLGGRKNKIENKDDEEEEEDNKENRFQRMMELHEDFNRNLAIKLKDAEKRDKEKFTQKKSLEDFYIDFQKNFEKYCETSLI